MRPIEDQTILITGANHANDEDARRRPRELSDRLTGLVTSR